MGHYSRKCPNLPSLSTKKNVGFFIRRFFAKEKGKTQVHLIEPVNEETLMGLENNLKILENVIDVMAQTKQLGDTTHHNINVKKFKEMAIAPKNKRKIENKGFDFKTF
jgi:hypothetical protein